MLRPAATGVPMTTAAAAPKAELAHIRELKAAQASIRAQIESIQHRLKELERFHDPDSLPYITFKTVTKIEDLRAPQVPLRKALRDDIKKLQEQAHALQLEMEAAKRHLSQSTKPHVTAAHHGIHAVPAQGGAVTKPSVPISPAKPTAVQPDPEMEKLVSVATKSMDQAINVLNADPSLDNIHDVLEAMAKVSQVGGDDKRGWDAVRTAGEKLQDQGIKEVNANPSFDNMHDLLESMKVLSLTGGDEKRGWEALQGAAGKRVNFAITVLRSDCNERNVAMVLMISKEAALLGNDEAAQGAISAAADATVTLRKGSEHKFRTAPTAENFQAYLKAMHDEGLLGNTTTLLESPPGLPFVRPGTVHHVKFGQTLLQISKLYFGKPIWWDVIVFRNFEQFRGTMPDPNQPLTIATLKIS